MMTSAPLARQVEQATLIFFINAYGGRLISLNTLVKLFILISNIYHIKKNLMLLIFFMQ
jgi:hypothetical protein